MLRSNQTPLTSVNCTLTGGGVGDLLCYLVAVDHIVRNLPYINLLLWVPEFLEEICHNVLPKERCVIRTHKEAKKKYNAKLPGLTTSWDGRSSPMRQHPVDYAFHVLVDKHIYDLSQKNYIKLNLETIDISRFTLPEKYITLQADGQETVKRLDPRVVNDIARYALIKGYKVVYIGSKATEGVDLGLGIDLTGKTSLIECGKMIANSKCFIGCDGGLTHLAGMTDVPIISGYTLVNPNHILPIRNNELGWNCYTVEPDDGCRYCQTDLPLYYGIDYRECLYSDYKCIKSLTFEKFRKEMDKVL